MTTTNAPSKTLPVTEKPAWKALEEHYRKISNVHLRSLFADDPLRGERLAAEGAGLYLDYSKNRITDETIRLLVNLAEECSLRERIEAMFHGEKINITENRAVLHIALRAPGSEKILVDGVNVVPEVHAVLDRMAVFSEQVRSGQWLGYSGKRIRNVINIGIGGSDLGPVMAYEVLKHYSERDMTFRFSSRTRTAPTSKRPHATLTPKKRSYHLFEDLHDPRNDDQCPYRPHMGAESAAP